MKDFFISYTANDRAWAEWIAWQLEQAGYSTVIQAWDFPPGSNFVVEMDRASKDTERTVAVLSRNYVDSVYATAEWAAAFAADPRGDQRKLVPVRVHEAELSGLLRQIVYIDLVDLDEAAARERLLEGVPHQRSRPASSPPYPGQAAPSFPGGAAPATPTETEADQQLDELPVDDVPERGPLPAGSCMPLRPNPLFLGREDSLRTLAAFLKARESGAVGQVDIVAITGLGGVGKTQLACEFVHRYGRFFAGGVFWMSFAEATAVPAEIAACGKRLAGSVFADMSLEDQLIFVSDAWQSSLPRLLVFDSCENPELLERWCPKFGESRVLITSRRSRWSPTLGVKTMPLRSLARTESVRLLRGFQTNRPDDSVLEEIAEELGDLPLALHLAGSFLNRYQHSPLGHPQQYLAQLRKSGLLEHTSLQGLGVELSPTDHKHHVVRTFALSFDQLEPDGTIDSVARSLLARTVCFAPGEQIPRRLLLASARIADDDWDGQLRFEDALRRLSDLGLLRNEADGAVHVHRLLAAFIAPMNLDDTALSDVEEAVYEEARRLNKAGDPGPLLAWQVHLRAVTEKAMKREDERSARLCSELDFHLTMVADLTDARAFSERALAIRKKVLGPDHPDTATSLLDLGVLLQNLGQFDEARAYQEQALAIFENRLGPEHPATARCLNNLGVLLHIQGDLEKASSYHARALAIREKKLGPDHPVTALSLNNLGSVLQAQGDLEAARIHHSRALAIYEEELGQDHPDTARSLNNLGTILKAQGDLEGAREYYDRALETLDAKLGPEHPDTRTVRQNLERILSPRSS